MGMCCEGVFLNVEKEEEECEGEQEEEATPVVEEVGWGEAGEDHGWCLVGGAGIVSARGG